MQEWCTGCEGSRRVCLQPGHASGGVQPGCRLRRRRGPSGNQVRAEVFPMKFICARLTAIAAALLPICCNDLAAQRGRDLPKPLAPHPGNIFVAGEEVIVPLPKSDARWSLLNYDGQSLGAVTTSDGEAALGKLDVGFYRLEQAGSNRWISLAVLAPLRAPTPATSPISM